MAIVSYLGGPLTSVLFLGVNSVRLGARSDLWVYGTTLLVTFLFYAHMASFGLPVTFEGRPWYEVIGPDLIAFANCGMIYQLRRKEIRAATISLSIANPWWWGAGAWMLGAIFTFGLAFFAAEILDIEPVVTSASARKSGL